MNKRKSKRKDNILQQKTEFSVVESYKTIRTNLLFSLNKSGCKKILFTSSIPREGKSTTCVNLSISLAQTDSKVLLIDCDLRKPRIHKFFRMSNTPGLANALGDFCKLSDIIKETTYPNLDVICSGVIPPNPAELLGCDRMGEFVEELSKRYDYIMFDAPPVNVVSDALPLTVITDGVVIITKHMQTKYPDLSKTIKSLEFVNANIIGLILNEVDYERGKYKYNYRYKYTYSD